METNGKFEVDVRDVEYQSLAGKPWLARVYQPKGSAHFRPSWTCTAARGTTAIGPIMPASTKRWRPRASWWPLSISGSRRRRAIPLRSATSTLRFAGLKLHAAEFSGTTVVGAFGNSSGGHQVVLSALRPRHPSYSALPLPQHPEINASLAYVIAGWPVIDPLYRFRYAKEINNQEHVKAHIEYWRTEEAMAEGSPQTIIEQDEQVELPPILMLLKANDKNHPLEMQERFIASYRKRGGAIEVHTFDGLPEHRMVPSPSQPETMRAIDTITAFIRRQTG